LAISIENEPPGDPNGTFGQRLQWYRQEQYRQRGDMPTRASIAAFVAQETDRSFSPPRLSALMDDTADRPVSLPQVAACAKFFGVSPIVFFGDEHSRHLLNKQAFLEACLEFQLLTGNAGDPTANEIAVYTRAYDSCHPDDLPTMTNAVRQLIDMLTEHANDTPAAPLFLQPQRAPERR
jgi:hypothetical protein